MTNFEKQIQYTFKNKSLLELATTHSSYAKEKGVGRDKCNERLEFLGDGFFDAIIGEELYKRKGFFNEGRLSKTRANVVCEASLAQKGRETGIGELIKLGKGESMDKGAEKDSIVADAMEAVIGAIYLESGYETVKEVVLNLFDDLLKEALKGKLNIDFKSKFQEKVQKSGNANIEYVIIEEKGEAHAKTFIVALISNGCKVGQGEGRSKKEAEKAAAEDALKGEN